MKEKKFNVTIKLLICALVMLCGLAVQSEVSYAKGKYTVKTSTSPCNKSYKKLSTYNSKTKQYYMLRSYLEKLESQGGGTLTLKKGTYKIPCTLYVPSNVTINLKKGVTLKKTSKTGSKKLTAGKSVFELVPPSVAASGKKTVKKYKGSTNVTIKGSGNPTINLASVEGSTAIAAGHNKKVSVSGIKFKNMNGGSFINIAASSSVSVTNCTFQGAKAVKNDSDKYAIRLEVPDSKTKAFDYPWSKADNKPNKKITISDNKFYKLNSAIGSTKYTENVLHTGIKISNNQFTTLSDSAIRILNWSMPYIEKNTFYKISNGDNNLACILASGVTTPSIVGNNFDYVAVPIKFAPAVNTGAGKNYPTTFNTVDNNTRTSILNNTVTNAALYYIPYQSTLSEKSVTRMGYFVDYVTKDYAITAGQRPYREYYTDNTWYNQYTNDYYVFKSYLEQLERVGGGTLTVNAGTYSITNSLYVPSNTKIIFKDGAVINKGTYTGFPNNILVPSQSVFQLVPPSLATGTEVVPGYNGSHDVEIIGEGNVIMDMLFYYGATAIIMAHNNNVVVRNINFRNYLGHHFMEINSSQNVLVENCTFIGSKSTSSKDDHKEAINIDTPDFNTGGLNLGWAKHDRTPINNVTIQNNSFDGVLRAIGSHKYSVSLIDNMTQVYHTNLNILNNTITNTMGYAIRGINWKNCVIKGNTFKNIKSGTVAAICMSGAVNPTITENIFDTANRPIILNSTDSSSSSLGDRVYPMTHTILDSKEVTGKNISDMLNNILIDINKPAIIYYVGGDEKANSSETLTYKYDPSKVSYTNSTPTPAPTDTPTAPPTSAPTPTPTPTPAPETPQDVQSPATSDKGAGMGTNGVNETPAPVITTAPPETEQAPAETTVPTEQPTEVPAA